MIPTICLACFGSHVASSLLRRHGTMLLPSIIRSLSFPSGVPSLKLNDITLTLPFVMEMFKVMGAQKEISGAQKIMFKAMLEHDAEPSPLFR